MSSLFPSIPSLALVMTNIQGRASLYRILFGFVTFVRLRSRGPANGDRQGAPWGSPLECSCVKLPPVLVRVIARLTAVSSAARGMLATRWPASCEVQAPAEVAHSHGLYRRPSTKRRAPGSWCDWGGLSHSGDPHTTMYRLTLPSVEHAGCAGLHTRQSRTRLATEETAAIRAMVQAQAHAASTQQRLGGRIFRAARSADGRWIARRAAR